MGISVFDGSGRFKEGFVGRVIDRVHTRTQSRFKDARALASLKNSCNRPRVAAGLIEATRSAMIAPSAGHDSLQCVHCPN